MQVWNLWGGLIYLIAPRNAQVDGAEVTVQVAVPAPYYKSGECVPPVCRRSSGWVDEVDVWLTYVRIDPLRRDHGWRLVTAAYGPLPLGRDGVRQHRRHGAFRSRP